MSSAIAFTKMHGLGNDYVYINGFDEQIPDPGALAVRLSERHRGIGSDGLVLVLPSSKADVRMRMFNPDGSEAEMCGNAIRCVGKYAAEHGLVKGDSILVETAAGLRTVSLLRKDGHIEGATVDMGAPVLTPADIPVLLPQGMENAQRFLRVPLDIAGQTFEVTAVSMGNPHAVVILPTLDGLELPLLGPALECHPLFPRRTNAEFVEVLSPTHVRMRVWERGTGETQACGTGACAVAAACVLNGRTGREVDVDLPGGTLHIRWDEETDHIFMTGPAQRVFDGVYYCQESLA